MGDAEIIDRLMKATEGSRELDAMVAEALGWERVKLISPRDSEWQSPGGKLFYRSQLPAFAGSLDAITAEIEARGGEWTVKQFKGRAPFVQAWMPGMGAEGKGATPALALCVALLRTIASPAPVPHA